MSFRTLENIIRDVFTGTSVKGTYTSFVNTVRNMYTVQEANVEVDQRDQITAGTYKTKHFEMSPKAQLFLTGMEKKPTMDYNALEKMTIEMDKLFGIHKTAKAKGFASDTEYADAMDIAKRIHLFASQNNLHGQVDFINDNLRSLKDLSKRDTKDTFPYATPTSGTKEKPDRDLDNSKLPISRNLKAQRKLKIIDDD